MDDQQNQNYDPNQQPVQPQVPPAEYPSAQQQPSIQPNIPDAEPSAVNTTGIPEGSPGDSLKPPPARGKGWSGFKGFVSIAELVGGALLLALAINSFVFQSYQVFGQSMEPTLQQGNRLIISKLAKSWNGLFGNEFLPSRGEVIVFQSPRDKNTQLVKRVIGLPGERVIVDRGSITVVNEENPDGFNPDELFEADLAEFTTGDADITVPDGHIFVSGDNRTPGGSLDSRNDLGTVPLELVVGTLSVRIFPLSDATFY